MESILGGLILSIVSGAKSDIEKRKKNIAAANVFAVIGIVGFVVAVAQMY